MHRISSPFRLILCLLAFLAMLAAQLQAEPESPTAVYLTWQRDPTTTLTVHWHSVAADQTPDQVQHRAVGEERWQTAAGSHRRIVNSDRLVHTVELRGLQPDTVYEFRVGNSPTIERARTLPDEPQRPLVYAAGGDIWKFRKIAEPLMAHAAARSPDFVIMGGDLAYADGDPAQVVRWFRFFEAWGELGITPDKRRIPIVAAIGNHELAEGYEQEPQDAPFFYDMLAFPGERGYGVLDVGDYLSVIVLDSGHTNPIPGRQSAWLHQTLTERKDRGVTHVVCVYHVPAYPGHRSYYGYYTGQVRNAFVPIMEYGEVDLAYEHHDHTWKRTHPIRNGQVHPFGIVYLGDGAWGVKARSAAQPGRWWQGGRWYLARAGAKNHVWITTLDGRERIVEAIDVNGEVFDRLRMVDGQPMRLPTPNYAADLIEWTFLLALVTALGVVALLMAERKLKPRR